MYFFINKNLMDFLSKIIEDKYGIIIYSDILDVIEEYSVECILFHYDWISHRRTDKLFIKMGFDIEDLDLIMYLDNIDSECVIETEDYNPDYRECQETKQLSKYKYGLCEGNEFSFSHKRYELYNLTKFTNVTLNMDTAIPNGYIFHPDIIEYFINNKRKSYMSQLGFRTYPTKTYTLIGNDKKITTSSKEENHVCYTCRDTLCMKSSCIIISDYSNPVTIYRF